MALDDDIPEATGPMGQRPGIDLRKALSLAGVLEHLG